MGKNLRVFTVLLCLVFVFIGLYFSCFLQLSKVFSGFVLLVGGFLLFLNQKRYFC